MPEETKPGTTPTVTLLTERDLAEIARIYDDTERVSVSDMARFYRLARWALNLTTAHAKYQDAKRRMDALYVNYPAYKDPGDAWREKQHAVSIDKDAALKEFQTLLAEIEEPQ
jgi:hypothetical protein